MKKTLLKSIFLLGGIVSFTVTNGSKAEAGKANVGGVDFVNGKYTNTNAYYPSFGGPMLNKTWIYNEMGNRLENDTASGVSLSPNTRVILTENHDYKGKSITIESKDGITVPSVVEPYHYSVYNYQTVKNGSVSLSQYSFNKKTSSIIIEDLGSEPKVPVVYEHDTFGGRTQELSVRNYRKRDLSFGNDRISSIRVPEGFTVQLFDDDNYKDRNYTFKGPMHIPFLEGFNDKTSSIKVTKS